MTSWDHGLTCLTPADLFSQAELDARPDVAYNPWICNHRGLMSTVDAGGTHAVSWAVNNADMRARLGTCLACGTPIFTRAVADAPLVAGSFLVLITTLFSC